MSWGTVIVKMLLLLLLGKESAIIVLVIIKGRTRWEVHHIILRWAYHKVWSHWRKLTTASIVVHLRAEFRWHERRWAREWWRALFHVKMFLGLLLMLVMLVEKWVVNHIRWSIHVKFVIRPV